jgi:hypothetical protein
MEYKCGSCREISLLSPKAKFCPVCGSSSLVLVVKELTEPTQRETVGVYNTATVDRTQEHEQRISQDFNIVKDAIEKAESEEAAEKEEEDRPRRRR